jgi:2-polyprenyl-6-methoxyphenol hydroxylase-like FAD-dependent oxidoreductase
VNAEIPVLIVGGGPVGLALAGELGWRGVACILVE